jgi:hypothetical protein
MPGLLVSRLRIELQPDNVSGIRGAAPTGYSHSLPKRPAEVGLAMQITGVDARDQVLQIVLNLFDRFDDYPSALGPDSHLLLHGQLCGFHQRTAESQRRAVSAFLDYGFHVGTPKIVYTL